MSIAHENRTKELEQKIEDLEAICDQLYKMVYHKALKKQGRAPDMYTLIGKNE